MNITIVAHFHDELSLNSLKVITEDVVEDDLVEGRDQLHDGMACVLVNEPSHRCVFKILELVTKMDRVDNLRVSNRHSLLILDLARQEFTEIGFLSHIRAKLISLLKVIVVAIATSIALG